MVMDTTFAELSKKIEHIRALPYGEYLWKGSIPKEFKEYQHKVYLEYYQDQELHMLNTEIRKSSKDAVEDFINDENTSAIFMVIAQAGVGKSTFSKKLIQSINLKKSLQSIYIPSQVLIDKYTKRRRETYPKIESIWELYNAYMYGHKEKSDLFLNQNLFEAALFTGKVVVIIDGLDEIITFFGTKFKVQEFIESVIQLNNELAACKIIITSREYYWKNNNILSVNNIPINKFYGFNEAYLKRYLEDRYGKNSPNSILVKKYLNEIDFHDSESVDIVKPYLVDLFCSISEKEMDGDDSNSSDYDSSLDEVCTYPNNCEIIDKAIFFILDREVSKQLRHKLEVTKLLDIYMFLAISFGKYFEYEDLITSIDIVIEENDLPKEDHKLILDAMLFSPLLSYDKLLNNYKIKYSFLNNYFIALYILDKLGSKTTKEKSLFDKDFVKHLAAFDEEDNASFHNIVKYFRKGKDRKNIFISNGKKIIESLIQQHQIEKYDANRWHIEHAISAILYLGINIDNKENSKEKKMNLIKELYGIDNHIKHLFIFGNFFSLDFSDMTVEMSTFDYYNNFLNSNFLNTKFIKTKIKHLDQNISNKYLDNFYQNATLDLDCEHEGCLNLKSTTYQMNIVKKELIEFISQNIFLPTTPYTTSVGVENLFANTLSKYGYLKVQYNSKSIIYELIKEYEGEIDTFTSSNRLTDKMMLVIRDILESRYG